MAMVSKQIESGGKTPGTFQWPHGKGPGLSHFHLANALQINVLTTDEMLNTQGSLTAANSLSVHLSDP